MENLTYPVLVGIVVPWLVALMTNDAMSSTKKRWVTIFITVAVSALVALGVALYYGVFNAEEIVKFIGVVFGVVAVVYATFKDHGIDWLRAKTNKIVLPEPATQDQIAEGTETILGTIIPTTAATTVVGPLSTSIVPDLIVEEEDADLVPFAEEAFYNDRKTE